MRAWNHLLLTIGVGSALLLSARPAGAANVQSFNPGSLIIPMESTFQTPCGLMSAYGLVYRILQQNANPNGFGGVAGAGPVTVYIANNEAKTSPNRCVPAYFNNSGTVTPMSMCTAASGNCSAAVADNSSTFTNWNAAAPSWNDGCDFQIPNNSSTQGLMAAGQQPVVSVNYSAYGSSFDWTTYLTPTTATTGAVHTYPNWDAWPQYQCTTSTTSLGKCTGPAANILTAANKFAQVQYSGASFVIDGLQAKQVLQLLTQGDNGTSGLPLWAFTQYAGAPPGAPSTIPGSAGADAPCTCHWDISTPEATGTTASWSSVSTAPNTGISSASGNAQISIQHLANDPWTPAASMDTGLCHYVDVHQSTTTFSATVDKQISQPPPPFAVLEFGSQNNSRGGSSTLHVLDDFLAVAGLWVINSGKKVFGSGTVTYDGVTVPGTIGVDTLGCPPNGSATCPDTGVTNPNQFSVSLSNGSTWRGLIADFFETGDIDAPSDVLNQTSGGSRLYQLFWTPHWDQKSDANGNDTNGLTHVSNFVAAGGALVAQCDSIRTLEGDESDVATAPYFMSTAHVAASAHSDDNVGPFHNCTDPGGGGSPCATFDAAGNIYGQVGDFQSGAYNGNTSTWQPSGGSFVSSVERMVHWTSGTTYTDTYDFEQNGTAGVVVYATGHDVSAVPQGTRIILNSMLNLGSPPIPNERDTTAPVVIYPDAGVSAPEVITATYDSISNYSSNPNVATLSGSITSIMSATTSSLESFVYPYYPGHLRASNLSTLLSGLSNFNVSTWDADAILSTGSSGIAPVPSQRNLFTYFGGYPSATTNLPGGAPAPNGVVQTGWRAEMITGKRLTPGACTDTLGYKVLDCSTLSYDDLEASGDCSGNGALYLVAGGDGKCDLQQAMNVMDQSSNGVWVSGKPSGNTVFSAANWTTGGVMTAWAANLIRGECFDASNTTMTSPTDPRTTDTADGSCLNGGAQNNRGHLGGFVNASPAVIGPSPNVTDSGGPRPTVAYAAGWDGELHAIYVGGGAGYSGTASTLHFEDASNVSPGAPAGLFANYGTNFSTKFASSAAVVPGTELWAFMPASQLPLALENAARVDSSPVVQDVFVDLVGSGIRQWHTILVASVGLAGNEVFAMDVTNPLQPVLLWDIVGSLVESGGWPAFSPTLLSSAQYAQGAASPLPGASNVLKWDQSPDSTLGISAAYYFTNTATTDPGRSLTNPYDYQSLGGATGITIGEVREGAEPVYLAWVSTSTPQSGPNANTVSGNGGVEVYAINLANGQKVWQWEDYYNGTLPSSDAVEPPRVTAMFGSDGISGAGGVNRVLVGEEQGLLWELDAQSGVNVNQATASVTYSVPNGGSAGSSCAPTTPCSYPLFSTQMTSDALLTPISTNIATAIMPATPGPLLTSYANDMMIVFGTGGASWVWGSWTPGTPYGKVYILPYAAGRVAPGTAPSGVLSPALTYSLGSSSSEVLYGTVSVSGEDVFFETATGALPSNPMQLASTVGGGTYVVDLGAVTSAATAATQIGGGVAGGANYGGVAIFNPTSGGPAVIGGQVGQLNRMNLSSLGVNTANAVPNASLSPSATKNGVNLNNWNFRSLQ